MSGAAIALLIVSLVVVWGGLAVSILALARRPERTDWPQGSQPDGGPEDRPDEPVEHDT
jgi:hypothetical protein